MYLYNKKTSWVFMKQLFPKNIGPSGRILRALIGLFLFVYAYKEKSILALIAALFTFFEACKSWCVVYHLLGIKSCPVRKIKK
jgi:predicted membrane protein